MRILRVLATLPALVTFSLSLAACGDEPEGPIDTCTGDECQPQPCTGDEYLDPTTGVCTALTICAPGEVAETAPTATSDRTCEPCRAGDECLGGDSPKRRCGWLDHDSDPSTPCTSIQGLFSGPSADHICIVMDSGSVRCWGANGSHQTEVPDTLPAATTVATGYEHTCALDTDGSVHCWGKGTSGQIDVPADLPTVTDIQAGYAHTCALDAQGQVHCWGRQPR